jgi:hypothetical protein
MIQSPISLVNVAINYGGFQHQRDALSWLQTQVNDRDKHGSLGWIFARMYRDNEDGSMIDLVNVMEYYAGLEHQTNALKFLEENTLIDVLDQFAKQWRSAPTLPDAINLDIPWDPQTDSRYVSQANRMCFSSSVFMCAAYVSRAFANRFKRDDDYLSFLHARFGDTTDPNAHLRALTSLGLTPKFRTDLSLAACIKLLQSGTPVAIGFLHRGSHDAPSGGGHYAALRGFTKDRNTFFLNDPFGSLLDNPPYSGNVINGRNVQYPRWILNNRFTPEVKGQDVSTGWGLYVTP